MEWKIPYNLDESREEFEKNIANSLVAPLRSLQTGMSQRSKYDKQVEVIYVKKSEPAPITYVATAKGFGIATPNESEVEYMTAEEFVKCLSQEDIRGIAHNLNISLESVPSPSQSSRTAL